MLHNFEISYSYIVNTVNIGVIVIVKNEMNWSVFIGKIYYQDAEYHEW